MQVFLNLVKNAAEAVPRSDGEIVLTTAYQRGVRDRGAGHQPAPESAADGRRSRTTAPGIPEDLQDHLFDPFVTTKAAGSGLGLALVAKIVGDHGGLIGFESEPRRTVFKVSLPIARRTGDARRRQRKRSDDQPRPSWSPTTTAPSARC